MKNIILFLCVCIGLLFGEANCLDVTSNMALSPVVTPATSFTSVSLPEVVTSQHSLDAAEKGIAASALNTNASEINVGVRRARWTCGDVCRTIGIGCVFLVCFGVIGVGGYYAGCEYVCKMF